MTRGRDEGLRDWLGAVHAFDDPINMTKAVRHGSRPTSLERARQDNGRFSLFASLVLTLCRHAHVLISELTAPETFNNRRTYPALGHIVIYPQRQLVYPG